MKKEKDSLLRRIQCVCFSGVAIIVSYIVTFYGKRALLNHEVDKAKIICGSAVAFSFLAAFIVVPFTHWLCRKIISYKEGRTSNGR